MLDSDIRKRMTINKKKTTRIIKSKQYETKEQRKISIADER